MMLQQRVTAALLLGLSTALLQAHANTGNVATLIAKKHEKFVEAGLVNPDKYLTVVGSAMRNLIAEQEIANRKACAWAKLQGNYCFPSKLLFKLGASSYVTPSPEELELWIAEHGVRAAYKKDKGLGKGMFDNAAYSEWKSKNKELVAKLMQAAEQPAYKELRAQQREIYEQYRTNQLAAAQAKENETTINNLQEALKSRARGAVAGAAGA
jgi:hypothetical protein